MKSSLKLYAFVSSVAAAAALLIGYLAASGPAVTPDAWHITAILAALALVAELFSYVLPRSASGSVSFIPYFAAVLLAPAWCVPASAFAVRLALDILQRRNGLKVVFNTAQTLLTLCIAVFAYRAFGGVPLIALRGQPLLAVGYSSGLAAVGAFAIALLAHSYSIATAIGLSSSERAAKVWKANSLTTLGLDIAAGPLVLVFAWVYVQFGPFAAAALWVPLLGLQQVHRANLELDQTNQELLQLMVKSIEARDPYTSGHSRRVQHYAVLVARAVGLSDRAVAEISQAALLHDVGKIYEKYGPILRKPDKLTPEEWAIMREHPGDGANLISTMTRLKGLTPAIRHHHENWDGTGYPDGIAGERIPVASRVIMFADTIDAMTSERPYRKPLSEDVVRAELVRGRGRQFDPHLTDLLLSSALWKQIFAGRPVHSGQISLTVLGRRAREHA